MYMQECHYRLLSNVDQPHLLRNEAEKKWKATLEFVSKVLFRMTTFVVLKRESFGLTNVRNGYTFRLYMTFYTGYIDSLPLRVNRRPTKIHHPSPSQEGYRTNSMSVRVLGKRFLTPRNSRRLCRKFHRHYLVTGDSPDVSTRIWKILGTSTFFGSPTYLGRHRFI